MTNAEKIFQQINDKKLEALNKFVEEHEPETEWLEFKEKADPSKGQLDIGDKENFAKALSGFLNSSGGVLIYGISGRDHAEGFKKISKLVEFRAHISSFLPKAIAPLPQDVQFEAISDPNGDDAGYLVVYCPQSDNPPHQVIMDSKEIRYRYYRRSGPHSIPMLHYELEDLFGRRPHPKPALGAKLFSNQTVNGKVVYIDIGLKNEGRGIFKYPSLRIVKAQGQTFDSYGIDGNHGYGLPKYVNWINGKEIPYFIGGANHVIPPLFELWVCRYSGNNNDFHLIAEINGEGLLPEKFELKINATTISLFREDSDKEQNIECSKIQMNE